MNEDKKNKLENELAEVMLRVLGNYITTGVRDDGLGKFLDCSVTFNFLHNAGGLKISNLVFESKDSNYTEESK